MLVCYYCQLRRKLQLGGNGCSPFLLCSHLKNTWILDWDIRLRLRTKGASHLYCIDVCSHSATSLSQNFVTLLFYGSFHTHPTARQKGRRSCLLMAPGACGSRLANQCESTSGTSFRQTISPGAHSVCCQSPDPFRSVPKQAGTPRAAVRAHTTARHLPKRSQSSWHLGMLSPPYPPACSTNIPQGQRAAGAGAARLLTCSIGVRRGRESFRSRHWYAPSCLCNLQWLSDRIPSWTQELFNAV